MFARIFLVALALIFSGCASDKAKLKDSRTAFLRDDFAAAEVALYSPDVYQQSQNRLMHYYLLGSIAMSKGEYSKAVYFLLKARSLANSIRSGAGVFEWFSSDYRSNPIEYSYIHYLLVMAYSLLADEGRSLAWSTPEIKDKDGSILVPTQSFEEKKFDAREVAEYRQKARAEILAWDTHLENLKRTYPTQKFYKEDLWARVLASYLHGSSGQNSEKRTAELLVGDAKKILEKEFGAYPSSHANHEKIQNLFERLKARTKTQAKNSHDSLFVVEAGVMGRYKIKRFHLGLSTLFGLIKDPVLRSLMEQIGLQVILSTAPEFGLIAFTGGMAGAIESGTANDEDSEFEGPPQFFSEAVDRSLGFEIRFPALALPPSDTTVSLQLSKDSKPLPEIALPVLSPLEEMVAVELRNREGKEMFEKGVRIGLEYLAILIPAIRTYRSAAAEGNVFKRLAVIAGYYIAKKIVDNANNPDLRSWNYLPKVIAGNVIDAQAGEYDARVRIENSFGKFEKDLGKIQLNSARATIIRKRIGDVPVLNHRALVQSLP